MRELACINGYCAIQPDERVLLWLDRSGTVDSHVVDALIEAIDETGAPLSVLRTKAPIFRYGESCGRGTGRISNANVMMHVFDLENAASVDNADIYRCMWENDLRVTSVIATTSRIMNSDWAHYPPELHYYMWIKSARLLCDTDAHLTDDLGTDLRTNCFPGRKAIRSRRRGRAWTRKPRSTARRERGNFSGGTIALCPKEVEGTVVFDLLEGFAGY